MLARIRGSSPSSEQSAAAAGRRTRRNDPFSEWIADDNFTLLGARDFAFSGSADVLEPAFESGLGLLRSRDARLLKRWNEPLAMTGEIRAFLEEPKLLIVTKSTVRSPVHRRVQLDYIGVKRFDRAGKLVGEHRFCGLFTSTAYTRPARTIPYLRRKIDGVIRRAGFDPSSHSGRALVNVLETYPRDEVFQLDEDTLYQFALAVLQLDERSRVRVLPRRDRFDRFVSVLVYVPRDRYGGQIRAAIGNYLATAFKGQLSAYHPFFQEGPLVRVHYVILLSDGETANPDRAVARPRRRSDRAELDGRPARGARCRSRPGTRTRALYALSRSLPDRLPRSLSAAVAVGDIGVIEALTPEHPLGVDFYRQGGGRARAPGLKVFSHNRPISLSERVPVLENMGFRVVDERTYHIEPAGAADVWFHDMELESAFGQDSISPRSRSGWKLASSS